MKTIDLYNQANSSLKIKISFDGLEDFIMIKSGDLNFVLEPKTKKTIDVRLISSANAGVYTGKIKIDSGKSIQEIQVKITVTKQELWFDVKIIIPWDSKIIGAGTNLSSYLNLIPVGLEKGFDVTTNYLIRNEEGKILITQTKTFFINGTYNQKEDFSTDFLAPGKYILELELIYPNGAAVSHSSFEIREGLSTIENPKRLFLFIGIGIFVLFVLIILIIWAMIRHINIEYLKIKHMRIRKPGKSGKIKEIIKNRRVK
jgi:hypothetical protein